MVTSAVIIALTGTLLFKCAISAAVNYEPIKITFNENFNSQNFHSFEPATVHQGANFYFKPQLNLPPSYIPPHIEDLISLIQQYHHSCIKDTSKIAFEKEKLMEIIKPFMYRLSDIPKDNLPKIVLRNENNSENMKPLKIISSGLEEISTKSLVEPIKITEEPKPVTPKLLVISEAPVLPPLSLINTPTVVEDMKKEKSMILEEPTNVFSTISEISVSPMQEPLFNYFEPKSTTPQLRAIPEAPVLPPLSLINTPTIFEDMKKEKSMILEEPTNVFSTISEISVSPMQEPLFNYFEPKSVTPQLRAIPEAPVLPPLSLNNIPSVFKEDVKKEESIILEEPTNVFPTIQEISVSPMQEPIINNVEPKFVTPELGVIPKAPVLPPLSLNNIPSVVEHVKKEESIILEEPTNVFPTIQEISVSPMQEPIINNVELKSVTPELGVIPKAPVLPPLSLNNIPSIFEGDVNKKESVVLEEPTGVFPTVSKISVSSMQEPIINYDEAKSVTPKLGVIPEAPVLPPLSLNNIPSVVEDVKKEESIILEEPTSVFPTISEISARPIQEPTINYVEPKPDSSELELIPEPPVLLPVSLNDIHVIEQEVKSENPILEPVIIEVEPKPLTPKLGVIPEAPVLPSLSLNNIPSVVEDVKKEESIILKESTNNFPTISEISAKPIQEPIINYVEPKPVSTELEIIPEAPVLSPFSLNDIQVVEQEVKGENPILEPVIVEVESKPLTPKLGVIPEAPVLPSLSLNNIPSVVEDVKKEESIILEESTNVFPTISDISAKPIQEPIINYVEPKPVSSELEIIPEAPVIPPFSLNDIQVVEQEVKGENPILEPVIIEVESIPVTPELGAIPEAPVLPPLSLNNIPFVVEDVKKKESIILEEPTAVFPKISEMSVTPIQEPIINYAVPKPVTPEIGVIPEAPVLPPLSLTNIPSVVEDVKKEESIILKEPTNVFPTIQEISVAPMQELTNNYVEPKPISSELEVIPEAPVILPFSLNDVHVVEKKVEGEIPISYVIIEEESKSVTPEVGAIPKAPVLPPLSLINIPSDVGNVKIQESTILEEPTGVFPTIPEISVRPMQEPIINYVELKAVTPELGIIPETPVLPSLSLNNMPSVVEENVKKDESMILEEPTNVFSTIPEISVSPMQEPIINYIELKPIISELEVIPEGSVLPRFSHSDLHVIEKNVNIEEPITLEDPTDGFRVIPEISIRPIPESIFTEIEPKPATPGLVVNPEPPVLLPQSYIGIPPIVEEIKIEESTKVRESTGVFPAFPKISALSEPSVVSETDTREVKIEVPILFEESIEEYPPNAETSPGMTFQEPEIANSYVLEEVSRPNPFSKRVVTIRETLPPASFPDPSNNLEAFSYVPFVSQLSNRAPNSKQFKISKPASLQRFLLKEHPFRLPVTPFPKKSPSISRYNKQFLLPRSYAHDIVEKRIAPNMTFKNNAPRLVRFFIRSNFPKGPSNL